MCRPKHGSTHAGERTPMLAMLAMLAMRHYFRLGLKDALPYDLAELCPMYHEASCSC